MARRGWSRSKTVEIGWEHPETEEAFRVVCSVGPVERPSFSSPGDPGEVEVLDVIEDCPGGASRPELIEVVEEHFGRIEDEAREAADEYDGPDTIAEARGER